MTRGFQSTSRTSAGFTLLEVLVALFVLSLGLLGLAGLQTLGIKFNQQSYQRTQAVILAYDMFDRMRANPVGKAAGLYDDVPYTDEPSDPACESKGCSVTERREADVHQWKQSVKQTLSEGKAKIETNTTTSVRTITIEWKENDLPMRLVVEAEV